MSHPLVRRFYFQFCRSQRRRLHQFLVALFAFFSLSIFVFHRLFQTPPSIFSLPQCPEQSLANLYQLHSLASSPPVRPSSLNWLHLRLWPLPSPHRLCPPSNPSSNAHSPHFSQHPFSPILAIVHSHFRHFAHRHSLRRQFRLHQIAAIFVVASANATVELAAKLGEEAEKEKDLLVLANLAEHYRRIAHKTRAWVGWLFAGKNWPSTKCHRPKLILKMDDDVAVNWPALGRLIQRAGPKPARLVLCRTFLAGQISRNPASKWFLSPREFASDAGGLGLYCQGLGVLFSWDLLAIAADNLRRVQFLWMDDWYLSHALFAGSNATFVDISPHIRNVEMDNNKLMAPFLGTNGIGPIPTVHYAPIFAHFRPAEQFSTRRKELEWAKMLEEGKEEKRRRWQCSL